MPMLDAYFSQELEIEHLLQVHIFLAHKAPAFLPPSDHQLSSLGLDVEQASSNSPISARTHVDPSRKAAVLRRHILQYQSCISAVAACDKPVIVLIHGYAYGLGIDLSAACDIRLCSPDAKFCVKEVDIGLAADVGTLSRLPKVLGGLTSWAKEICLTARPFSAEEAARNNFVSRVVPG